MVTGVSRSVDGGVAVTVTDDGAGIPAEFVDRVFARFARADASAPSAFRPAKGRPLPVWLGKRQPREPAGWGCRSCSRSSKPMGGFCRRNIMPRRIRFTMRLPATITAQGDAPHP